MKKRMKKVATLCLAGVTAMSTVGVTGSAVFAKGDTNYDVDNMDFENVELRVAFRFNNGSDTDGQAKWYYKALEEFNKENEGKIHVTDESISTESDYEEKLTTDFASGNVPNAFLQYGGSRTREYVDAVSYTHLRAHETRSNLVCRLLLEKIFFNDTATTEIYTRKIVGSVRCV